MELIFLCLVLAFVAVYFGVKNYSRKAWNEQLEKDVVLKDATIVSQTKQIAMYVSEFSQINAKNRELRQLVTLFENENDSIVAQNEDLQNQVKLLVTQINETGVRRNKKGQFVSVD